MLAREAFAVDKHKLISQIQSPTTIFQPPIFLPQLNSFGSLVQVYQVYRITGNQIFRCQVKQFKPTVQVAHLTASCGAVFSVGQLDGL